MAEFDRQYKADLERAQALSVETHALEQFKQQRKLLTNIPSSDIECDGLLQPNRSRSNSSGFPPAIPPPPRRPGRRTRSSPYVEENRAMSDSPTSCENENVDLICFNTPSSTEKSRNDLKEQINQIHRLNQQTDQLSIGINTNVIPNLSRSNSSMMTHSQQNIIPYTPSSIINPLINFPSQQYFMPTNQPMHAANKSNYESNIINNSTIVLQSYNTLYPNLSNSAINHIGFQQQQPFNNSTFGPPPIASLAANPSSYPQLNVLIKNQTNMSCGDISNKSLDVSNPIANTMSSDRMSDGNLIGAYESDAKFMNFAQAKELRNTSIRKSESMDVNLTKINTSQPWGVVSKEVNLQLSFGKTFQSETSNKKSNMEKTLDSPENLIDLAVNVSSNSEIYQAGVLETFDPLVAEQYSNDYMLRSECSSSIYEEFDPLDFVYAEVKSPKDTPVYSVINRRARDSVLSPLPSPPPKSLPPQPPTLKRNNTTNKKLYETVTVVKTRRYEPELIAFLDMLKEVRANYPHSNKFTNPGYVVAIKSEGKYSSGTSLKILVYYKEYQPIAFTCDVESTVDHVVLHVVCELEGEIKEDISQYSLRVWGMSEYLTSGSCLSEYNYVRECVRLEKDILFCLQFKSDTRLARTERDDIRDCHISLDRILPNQGSSPPISFHNLSILLETLERELSRVITSVTEGTNVRIGATAQAVKAICALLGGVETVHISTALGTLIHACNMANPETNIMKPEIISESGDYSNISLRHATLKDTVGLHCQRLREAIRGFISIYCRANRVDFELEENQYTHPNNHEVSTPSTSIVETALFCIEGIHRVPVHWNHDEFIVHAQIYYGTTCLKGSQSTMPCAMNTSGFYPRILFETWLNLNDICIANLPREARLVVTLSGRTLPKPDNQSGTVSEKDKSIDTSQKDMSEKRDDDDDSSFSMVHVELEELGWSAIQLFDYEGLLVSGSFILPIWPICANKRLGPAPDITDYPVQLHPFMLIEIPSYSNGTVCWKETAPNDNCVSNKNRHSFESLDIHTQKQLLHLVEQGPHQKMPTDCREILWEKRHYLVEIPCALPLILQTSMNWDAFNRWQLVQILNQWASLSLYDALHLLLPCFPDKFIRAKAVEWLSQTPVDVLTTLMPQLCLALRYEPYVGSPLTKLLLSRAMESPHFAHRLYWQLIHDIPGNSPQNSSEESLGINFDGDPYPGIEPDESIVSTCRWVRRSQIVLRSLLEIVGKNLGERLLKQQLLVKGLSEVANCIKKCKENVRNTNLAIGVNTLVPLVTSGNVCLPLSISQELFNIDVKSCSYFPSNTLPLKISFISSDQTIVPAIFKIGDDLRQDALVLQVIKIIDQLWLKEGLDLSMVTFEAVPTQYRKGIIEMVCNAETLRSIQVEWGLTGSFKDKPIAEWLAKHNPSELEYERAVTNFTASCAGYSVATYLLGICDRHNDNIMLKTSGHLFHIDFGKFLGDAQMFGNFKRDRTPFVLTPDMAYVINGGERPSQRFHHFVDLCCTAFNIVRKHQNLILNLFSLMASSGITGVSASAVGYVRAALLPGQTPAEAAAAFARLIHSALKSKFTPINFFLHNLAQFRVGDQAVSSNDSLSFMPKTYTMEQDGRLTNVDVLGYEKRYEPEKYYVYSLRIFRLGQVTPFILYRSYKHFTELYQKICLQHPLAKIHRLPVGLHMGRSNTKQAAERRFGDIKAFLTSLFLLADEIAHSKLVYTFFHPLLRDQQDVEPQRVKHRSEVQRNIQEGVGALKISIQYSAGVLAVLILHAKSLTLTPQGVPPSPYVKVYLIPDPSKETKRKTRVLKRNSHPSFMEMLEYRLPLEVIRGRDLKATVWHHDPLQENQFLGGIRLQLHSMPLTNETVRWYPLEYLSRHS